MFFSFQPKKEKEKRFLGFMIFWIEFLVNLSLIMWTSFEMYRSSFCCA